MPAPLQSINARGTLRGMQLESSVRILIIDSHGQPVRWALLMRAARYYAAGKVVTDLGDNLFSMTGGLQERSGLRSEFVTSSIVMIRGRHRIPYGHAHVGLTKHRLFSRDRQICAYCAQAHPESELTVEHILPVSRGGRQTWTNVVTACRRCNQFKGSRTLTQCGLELLALPYTPNMAEYLALVNGRRIRGDQMEFLRAQFPPCSRLRA